MKMVLVASLQLVLFIIALSSAEAHAAASLRGIVQDENGIPIEDTTVSVWLMKRPVISSRTGSDGRFEFEVEAEACYTVYVFADNCSTPGVDYLPSRAEVAPFNGDELKFTLASAASLVFEGDIHFVESEKQPFTVVYVVLDPESNRVMNIGAFPLIYGSAPESQSAFLGLEVSHLVVPAGVTFTVTVNSSVLVESAPVPRSFKADEPDIFMLKKGQLVTIDVRRYSIPYNLGVVKALYNKVDSRINYMESIGFYLTSERGTSISAVRQLSEAEYLYEEDRYIESFDAAKRSFIALRQTSKDLAGLYSDATLSVHILVFFFAFASVAIAFLLANRDSTKLLGSAAVYAATLAILYLTYPGSIIVPLTHFSGSAALAIVSSLTVAALLPRLLRGRGRDGHVPVRNIVVPIFSIAKRSIRRRRLRSALTLTSITVLVMSFVALTSFSEGYGLIVSRVSSRRALMKGILLRAPGYTKAEPTFITPTDINSGWLERQPESRVISPKAENLPITQPVANLNGVPIFGILGIDPAVESAIIHLEAVLKEGELLSNGGILISDALRGELGAEVGDSLVLSDLAHTRIRITIQGVFDDDTFRKLRDIDGSTYLPMKLVDATPEGSPTFMLTMCKPFEIVVANLSTALRMPLVGITRVDITVGEEVNVNAFAERFALERGYKVWSSSSDGIYFTRLCSYLEWKGLPLLVPWGIVVLNVVVTMLNSIYERRKEIQTLSSVGLNPTQIAAIFVAESSILGIIAGGVGYLGGLSLYRAMAFFQLALEVHQKVSAFWSLAAFGIAMTAVLIGALAALKSSVVITPSLMRRWRIEKKREDLTEPWELIIPVKLLPEETEGFVDFVVRALKAREDDLVRRTSSIRVSREAEEAIKRVDFVYKASNSLDASNFYTKNALLVERRSCEEIGVKLLSYGNHDYVYTTGMLMRMIAIEWSRIRGETGGSALGRIE